MDCSPSHEQRGGPIIGAFAAARRRMKMTKVAILGIDLAKNVFQLHGVDSEGRPALKSRIRREGC
jgi:hypothetical protein